MMRRTLIVLFFALALIGCENSVHEPPSQFAGRCYLTEDGGKAILFGGYQRTCTIAPMQLMQQLHARQMDVPTVSYIDDGAGRIVAGDTAITYDPADTSVLYIGTERYGER